MLASIISSMRLLTDPPFFFGGDLDLDFDFAFGFALACGVRPLDDAAVEWSAPNSWSSCEEMRSLSDAFTTS